MPISKKANTTFPKQGDIPSPDNMYNVGIVGTASLMEVDSLMKPFKSTTRRIELIQPSPREGLTFFYSNTQGRIKPVMDIEMKVLESVNENAPIDLFVIIGNKTIERLQDNIDRVKTIKKFAPSGQILLVCDKPEETIERFNTIKEKSDIDGLGIIGEDNIVSWEQSHSEVINRTGATPPQYMQKITNYTLEDNHKHSDYLIKQYNKLPSIIRAHAISDDLHGNLIDNNIYARDYRSDYELYDTVHDL